MLSNEAGIYYYFPTQNKAIKVLFLPKMTNSINSTLAGLPKVIPSNDQISLHDEIINGKSRTVAQLILSDQQKSNYLLALQGSLQSLGSGQDAINENLTSVSGIKYYIDKDSGLLLGQRLINSHNQEVFGLVYSSMTPAEPSDDQFEFPKTTLTYNANSPEELSDLMFKIILDE
jgi:hypothetical protein